MFVLLACADCSSGDPVTRDACFQGRVAASPTATEARTWIARIEDPMARDVALLLWVDANRATGGRDAESLCEDLTSAVDREACRRRFSAAHLNR